MHPEKEGKYLLSRLVEMWGYYTDGWKFSCTWDGSVNGWELKAEHPNPNERGPVRVFTVVSRPDWEDHHHSIVDNMAERMYMDTFREECKVREDGKTPEERFLEMRG